MNVLSVSEAAYIAGIIDGEGSVLVTRSRRSENRSGYRFYPCVTIISTSRNMLEYVQTVTGLGKIYNHSLSKNMKAKRVAYRWQIKQQIAGNFLRQIEPYMIIKRDSAQNCIAFCDSVVNRGNYLNYDLEKMEFFWRESSRLNGRGTLIDEKNPPKTTQGKSMAEMRTYEKGAQSMSFQDAMIKFAQINGHYPKDGEYTPPTECPVLV